MRWKTALTKIETEGEIIRGEKAIDLLQQKSFTEVIFLLIKGVLPTKEETTMLNALLVACIDHGAGAPSATVARTVASTGNSLHTALAAGILALGDLHGGAIEGAAQFFQNNHNVAEITELAKTLKAAKVRVPGYGHKVLEKDHRSSALFAVAKTNGFYKEHCRFAEKFEEALSEVSSKKLPINIDGAMAAILSDMGFGWQLMKAFFIIGRTPGLLMHAYEQMMSGEGVKRIDESDIDFIG